MLFATLFNPPKKGKVLRKRTHNFTSADDAAHHQNAPPPVAITRLPPPEITITPGPETEDGPPRFVPPPPPPPSKSPRPKAARTVSGTSLKKRNSHMPPPIPPPQAQAQREGEEGPREGTKPKRRKSLIKSILEKRRERVEAANNYYNVYPGREEVEREYDPSLGVDNLPKPHYSGLLIGSSELRNAGGGGSTEEIGLAVSSDEKKRRESSVVRNFRQERREELEDVLAGDRIGKGKQRESSIPRPGGYWGDLPSHSYGGSYGGMHGVGYVGDVGPYDGSYGDGRRSYGGEAQRGGVQGGYDVVGVEGLNHHPQQPYPHPVPQRPYQSGDEIGRG
ncbi:hypothetical protein N431DRAFT_477687 [Stipitochalara longipes BDJ]|nr:hypothetical protein N431DRAFT_477687 [Stipitochalara longipes BDJ]